MPADYLACVDSYVEKGVSKKTAKARCAAWFYKKHGYTVNEAHSKANSTVPEEVESIDVSAKEYVKDVPEDYFSDIDEELVKLMLAELEDLEANEVVAEAKAKSEIIAVNLDLLDELSVIEIIATKVGAKAYTSDGLAVTWTKRALKKAQDSWKFTVASINHLPNDYGRVIGSFLEKNELRMVIKVNDELKTWLKAAGKLIGVSIEASEAKINKNHEIINAVGSGITFVFPPEFPACSQEDGCGIVATDEIERKVWISIKDVEDKSDAPDNTIETSVESTLKEEKKETEENEGVKMPETQEKVQETVEPNVEAAEPEKKEETVCAKVHAKIVGEKEAEIDRLSKELEAKAATIAAYELDKKTRLLDELKANKIDVETVKESSIPDLEKMLFAITAFKKAQDEAPEEDSGVSVNAVEQPTDKSGEAVSNAAEEKLPQEPKKDEVLDLTWKLAQERYNLKPPAKK